jgi:dienelactone hydrolase
VTTPATGPLDVGDLTFTVTTAGPEDGELVVLLHGFPQVSACWHRVVPALADAGYRVLAPDQQGAEHGMLAEDAAGLRFIYLASGLTEEEAARTSPRCRAPRPWAPRSTGTGPPAAT